MPHQLTNFSPGRIFDFNWSWDGKRLLLVHGEVSSDVVLLNIPTKSDVTGRKGGLASRAMGGNHDERRFGQFSLRFSF